VVHCRIAARYNINTAITQPKTRTVQATYTDFVVRLGGGLHVAHQGLFDTNHQVHFGCRFDEMEDGARTTGGTSRRRPLDHLARIVVVDIDRKVLRHTTTFFQIVNGTSQVLWFDLLHGIEFEFD
jgi:hypothetical protein